MAEHIVLRHVMHGTENKVSVLAENVVASMGAWWSEAWLWSQTQL